jgi:hypothetical protein
MNRLHTLFVALDVDVRLDAEVPHIVDAIVDPHCTRRGDSEGCQHDSLFICVQQHQKECVTGRAENDAPRRSFAWDAGAAKKKKVGQLPARRKICRRA